MSTLIDYPQIRAEVAERNKLWNVKQAAKKAMAVLDECGVSEPEIEELRAAINEAEK